MFLGLFRRKVKIVTVKKKKKVSRVRPAKAKKTKIKKAKISKKVVRAKVRKPATKKTKTTASSLKVMPQIVGKVTHYFPHVKAGVILVTQGSVSLGDTLLIKGHTTDFKQKVNSMQIDNLPIKQTKTGDEVGLLVKSRVRHNDVVYKL